MITTAMIEAMHASLSSLDDAPDDRGKIVQGRICADNLALLLRHIGHPYSPPELDDDEDPGPQENGDGFVTLGSAPGGRIDYEVRLEGIVRGQFPTGDIAIYELAKAMSETGSFPAAWMEGEHGPSSRSIDSEVRRFHDADNDGLLPLPGARFSPGDLVTVPAGDWTSWVVIGDYGDMGVILHTEGDPSVRVLMPAQHVTPRAGTCGICGHEVIRQDTGLLEDPALPESTDAARYCEDSPDRTHQHRS